MSQTSSGNPHYFVLWKPQSILHCPKPKLKSWKDVFLMWSSSIDHLLKHGLLFSWWLLYTMYILYIQWWRYIFLTGQIDVTVRWMRQSVRDGGTLRGVGWYIQAYHTYIWEETGFWGIVELSLYIRHLNQLHSVICFDSTPLIVCVLVYFSLSLSLSLLLLSISVCPCLL